MIGAKSTTRLSLAVMLADACGTSPSSLSFQLKINTSATQAVNFLPTFVVLPERRLTVEDLPFGQEWKSRRKQANSLISS